MSKSAFIKMDANRYFKPSGVASVIKGMSKYPGFRFMVFMRLCAGSSRYSPTGIFARFVYKRMQVRYGFQIPFISKIGGGLFLGHFGNIVINQGTTIGNNCNIAQGVTIGQVNRGSKKGCPKIGDRVWIGANAVIVGDITIGSDVLIAPLSYVINDVPDKAVVTGNPAAILSYKGSGGYINNLE